jgi:membrane-associated phospholipid phosphatase
MPSGHSTVAFILSTVLSRNVDSPVLKVIACLPAVLTFASRVYQDQHWTSDTFVGAAIGYFVATWVVDQHENKKSLLEITSTFPFTVRIAL